MNDTCCKSRDRTRAYRERLAGTGEPPAYIVANAVVTAVVEAKLANERSVDPEELLACAVASVAADSRYSDAGVKAVLSRLGRPVDRRKRGVR